MNKLPMKAVLAAILCNVLFGSAFPVIKLGYEFFGIYDDAFTKILYAGIRFLISGIVVFIIDAIRQKKIPVIRKENRMNVFLLAITYTSLQYIFFYVGLSNTTGASGSVVNSASVFIAIIFAHFVYPDDKMTVKKLFGCIIGFSGVVIACFANEGISGVSFEGEGLILIAGTFFVVGSMINKKASRLNSSYTVTAYNLLIGGFLLIIIGAIGSKEGIIVTLPGIFALMYLIMVSSVGFTMWSMLLKAYPIGKLSVYNFIIPVSGTMLSGLFLKESIFTWQYISSLILVSAGIFVLNYSKEK